MPEGGAPDEVAAIGDRDLRSGDISGREGCFREGFGFG
jgi:hypothetical protein